MRALIPFRSHRLSAGKLFARAWISSALLAAFAFAETPNPHDVPIIDADAGPCSVEMTVTDSAAKPVYAATIRVHISHGFLGMRKTDLQVGTNVDGKARFIGLPDNLDEVLYFHASKGKLKGTAYSNPAKNCHARHFIILHKP